MRTPTKAVFHTDTTTVPNAIAVDVNYPDQKLITNAVHADGYKAIIDPATNNLYGILSTKYKIMQHTDVLSKIEDCIYKHPEYGTPVRNITTIQNGAKLRATYRFPEVDVTIKSGDIVHPQIEIRNGYDGMWSFGCLFGAFRLVCSNGLVIGEKVLQFKRKHYNPAQQFLMTDMLTDSLENFSEQTEIWKGWLEKIMTPEEVQNDLNALDLREKEMESLSEEVEISSGVTIATQAITQWIFYNILMQYITHRIESVNRQVELQARLRKVF